MPVSLEDAFKGVTPSEDEPTHEDEPQPQDAETGETSEAEAAAETAEAKAPQTDDGADKAETQSEKRGEQPRDASGRFQHWSEKAYLDEKSKRQELEKEREVLRQQAARAEELEREIQRIQSLQQRQQRRPQIDPLSDPNGFNQSIEQRLVHARWQTRLEISEDRAVDKHGRETVDAAIQAVTQLSARNPEFGLQFRTRDPVGDMVSWHKKQQALDKIGDDPEAYIEQELQRRLEALRNAPAEPAAQKPKPDPKALPTDLGATPSVGQRGGGTWSGPAALDDIFQRS